MKRRILWLILFTGLLALVACAAEEKATPAPTTPGAEASLGVTGVTAGRTSSRAPSS